MERIRVLLADDHPMTRSGIRVFLEYQGDFEIVGEADDGVQTLRLAEELKPDIVLLDVRMPMLDGIAVTRAIRHSAPETRVVVFTGHDEDQRSAMELLRLGVKGFLYKTAAFSVLTSALRTVYRGDSYVEPSIARQLIRDASVPRDDPTPRELDVLRLVAEGKRDHDVADHLAISERTVHFHVTNLFTKLGASNRMEMVRRARERGWID
ncbi:MAG: response regulator [Chloroflexota bacterium]